MLNKTSKRSPIHLATVLVLIFSFISSSLYIPQAQADSMPLLPGPGVMMHLTSEFNPAHLQGLIIHPDNALRFDFLIQRGDEPLNKIQKKEQYTKLVKYFLASLTVPDEDQWVNLSPYEKDRIIKDDFGKTEMGRDLLAQDYILKQMTSSLIYPEQNLGKKFWERVYERAYKEYKTTHIPLNTFNKVWIIPDEAAVYESGNTVFVLRNHLKVMLEQDYLSLNRHIAMAQADIKSVNKIGSQIVREIILPELEKEVNSGKSFANLRQIYSGMILATWYKHALKESLLAKVYANQAKVKGVDQNPRNNQAIYQRYLKAFKKGVFNYIKEDVDKYTHQTISRKYFSGGAVDFASVATGHDVTSGFRNAVVLDLNAKTGIPSSVRGSMDLATISGENVDSASVVLQTDQDVKIAGDPFSQGLALGVQLLEQRLTPGNVDAAMVGVLEELKRILTEQKDRVLSILRSMKYKTSQIRDAYDRIMSAVNNVLSKVRVRASIRPRTMLPMMLAVGVLVSACPQRDHRPPEDAFVNIKDDGGRRDYPLIIIKDDGDSRDRTKTPPIDVDTDNLINRGRPGTYGPDKDGGRATYYDFVPSFHVTKGQEVTFVYDLEGGSKVAIQFLLDGQDPSVRPADMADLIIVDGSGKHITRTVKIPKDGNLDRIAAQWGTQAWDIPLNPTLPSSLTISSIHLGKSISSDKAMAGEPTAVASDWNQGGIDFNATHLNLHIKRDGKGVPLPLAKQDMAQLSRIQGFIPEIFEIGPVVNLPIIGELRQKFQPL